MDEVQLCKDKSAGKSRSKAMKTEGERNPRVPEGVSQPFRRD